LITAQLNHERVGLAPAGNIGGPLRRVVQWAKDTELDDGRRVIDEEWVQVALARVHAKNDALKLWNWKVASRLETGELGPAEASAMKIFGTEFQIDALRTLMEVVGQPALATRGAPEAVLVGELEHAYRAAPVRTFGGGVNEVQRDIVAQVALGMPRSPR
jgi:alkylation response protein AidB-like acyl-CoA dehydrogenase